MENERDNAFTSPGLGGIDQSSDYGTSSSSTFATSDGGTGQPTAARAREAVSLAGQRAAERVQERIADQKDRATDSLEGVANSLRTASEQLPQEGLGRYMLQAATQVDNLASFLNNREVTELFDEVEGFARRQPAVFLGGAFALGVLGARFLRSSRQNIDGGARSWQSTGGTTRTDSSYDRPAGSMGNTGYSSGQSTAGQAYTAGGSSAGQGYGTGGSSSAGQGYGAGSAARTGGSSSDGLDRSTSPSDAGYSGSSSTTPGHTSGTMDSPDSGSGRSGGATGYGSSSGTGTSQSKAPDYL